MSFSEPIRGEAVEAMEVVVRYLRQVSDCKLDTEHTDKTALRFIKMMEELVTSDDHWQVTTFESERDEMIIVRDIQFTSVCAHHLAPFSGVAHVGYIPGESKRLLGLSKLARIVQLFAKNLQVQEELTGSIAAAIDAAVGALGVAVVVEAEHTCMTIRGVQAKGSMTTTSCMRGVFADHERQARAEFLSLIRAQ